MRTKILLFVTIRIISPKIYKIHKEVRYSINGYLLNLFIGRSHLEAQRKSTLTKFNPSHCKCYTEATNSREAMAVCFIRNYLQHSV